MSRLKNALRTLADAVQPSARARKRELTLADLRVLFICSGNICRSPTAEGVFRQRVRDAGLGERIFVDSAGTHGFHLGSPPDSRAQQAAAERGFDLSDLRSRRVTPDDYLVFDYIVCMDDDNLSILRENCPDEHHEKLSLFMSYVADATNPQIPDPYYGSRQGFEVALDMIEPAAEALLAHLRARL